MASQAEVDLVISTAGALPQLERDLNNIITVAEDGAQTLDVQAGLAVAGSLAGIITDLDNVINSAEAGADDIELQAVVDQRNSLNELRAGLHDVITISQNNVDNIDLRAALDGVNSLPAVQAELRRIVTVAEATAPEIELEVDVDRDGRGLRAARSLGRGLTSIVGPLGRVAGGIGAAGLAAGAAVPLIAGLATAVAQIAPASALAVSGLLTLQLASGTLKLAMQGVGDAVKTAFDPKAKPKELAEAMAKLSPAARAFVTELRGMQKQFKRLQQDVQQNVFQGLDVALRDLGKTVFPVVEEAMQRTSGELNKMALNTADAASKLGKSGTLGKALDGSVRGLENLNKLPAEFVTGLTQIAAAAAPAFGRVTAAVGRAATGISNRLSQAFASGDLERAIDRAIEAVKQLGRIFGNIFGGIGNIIGGVTASGEGLFGILEKITKAFKDITGTEAFQNALKAAVDTVHVLLDALTPLIKQGLEIILPLFEKLAPVVQNLITILAPAIGQILTALGPLLEQLANLIVKINDDLLPILQPLIDLLVRVAVEGLEFLTGVIKNAVIPALQILVNFLNGDFRAAWEGTKELTADVAREVTEQTFSMKDEVIRGFNLLGQGATSSLATTKGSVIDSFSVMVRESVAIVARLPGQILASLAGAGRVLFQVGRDLIQGLINGMASMLGSLRSMAESVADAAAGAVRGALGIRSPSRVMMEVGNDTMDGFILGLADRIPDLRRELQGVASLAPSFALPGGQVLALPQMRSSEPVVQVYLGNELLNSHVDTRIAHSSSARDRLMVQGVRR